MYDYKCDVKLKVGEDCFRAHKEVLSDSSMYFEAMFSHDMLEKEQCEIQLHEISLTGFSPMMEYFYHGHITLSTTNIADVIEAARFFHIDWLIRICSHFLIRRLSLQNYESVLDLAEKYYLGDLRDDIFRTISSQFMTLAKESTFMSVSHDVLHPLLANDYYIDAPERFILHTILRWLDHDKEDREKYALPLLRLVRYCLIEIEELLSLPAELRDIPELNDMIEYAVTYHANPTSQCLKACDFTSSRGATKALVLIDSTEIESHFQYKIPGTKDFLKEAIDPGFMESGLEHASVAVLGNFLFVAGGYDLQTWCSSSCFYVFDPRYRTWAKLTSMRSPRVSFPLVAGEDGLYAIAGIEHVVEDGLDRERFHHTVEFYDPGTNTWELLPELPFGCFSCAAVMYRGNLYVSGGVSSRADDNVPTKYLFAHVSRNWVQLPKMEIARQGHSMLAHDNKLIVVGGFTEMSDLMTFDTSLRNESYDLETSQWSYIREIPAVYGHLHHATTRYDNEQYYILGGLHTTSPRFLHSYNAGTDELLPGEFCGLNIQKLVTLSVSLPPECLPVENEGEGHDEAVEDEVV